MVARSCHAEFFFYGELVALALFQTTIQDFYLMEVEAVTVFFCADDLDLGITT